MQSIYFKKEDLYESVVKHFDNKDLISLEDILDLVEEQQYDIERLQEEFEDYKEYVKENYNMKSPYEIYGINEEDFH